MSDDVKEIEKAVDELVAAAQEGTREDRLHACVILLHTAMSGLAAALESLEARVEALEEREKQWTKLPFNPSVN